MTNSCGHRETLPTSSSPIHVQVSVQFPGMKFCSASYYFPFLLQVSKTEFPKKLESLPLTKVKNLLGS